MEFICVFKLLDKRRHLPFPIQGRASRPYASAQFSEKYDGHVFEMSLSDAAKAFPDMLTRFDMPGCKFFLVAIRAPDHEAEIDRLKGELAEATSKLEFLPPPKSRAEWNFKEWLAHAKSIGLPRYSMIAKKGEKAPLIAAVEAHEKATATKNGESSEAPAPSSQAA